MNMKTLPWRILVVTDAGVDSVAPRRLEAGDIDGWLASLEAGVDLPAAGGRPARRLMLPDRAAFSPGAITAALGGTASTAEIDAVLHHPAFQRLESAWRGLELLSRHAGAAVQIEIISLPRQKLAERF